MNNAQFSLNDISNKFGGSVHGDGTVKIDGVSSLGNAITGKLGFIADKKYQALLLITKASALIVNEENAGVSALPQIITKNPYAYFAKVAHLFSENNTFEASIHPSAIIDETAKLHESVQIGAGVIIESKVVIDQGAIVASGCVLGRNSRIGAHSKLESNVVIYHDVVIGEACVIASGTVVGADGFGYAEENGQWIKIPQIGRVIIGNSVEIGANTTIDRGALDDTVIEDGVKLDNLIQIGHNCTIGAHTVIAGCVGVAGSAKIGRYCKIGGAAMILGHLEIADGVTISPGSMITRSIVRADKYTAVMPFQTHTEWLKTAAHIRRLDKMAKKIEHLEHLLSIGKKEKQ